MAQTQTKTKPVEKAVQAQKRELPDVQVVTALNLKRKIVKGPVKRCPFFISDADFTDLTLIGIKLGVTWDEVLRGLISQMQASPDALSSLKHFIL